MLMSGPGWRTVDAVQQLLRRPAVNRPRTTLVDLTVPCAFPVAAGGWSSWPQPHSPSCESAIPQAPGHPCRLRRTCNLSMRSARTKWQALYRSLMYAAAVMVEPPRREAEAGQAEACFSVAQLCLLLARFSANYSFTCMQSTYALLLLVRWNYGKAAAHLPLFAVLAPAPPALAPAPDPTLLTLLLLLPMLLRFLRLRLSCRLLLRRSLLLLRCQCPSERFPHCAGSSALGTVLLCSGFVIAGVQVRRASRFTSH